MLSRSITSVALVGLVLGVSVARGRADDKPAPPTGRFRGDIVDPVKKDVIMKVALWAPEKLPETRRLSLLILHHGYQGNENNYIGLTVDALKRLKLDGEFVVVSGKSKGPGWTVDDDERVLRIIDWAKQNYPIDPRRVFLFGSSNGAAFVGRFGSEQQDKIAGVVGYCGNYKFNAEKMKAENAAETKTEWYFVHGGKDSPQNSRKACDFLKERGYRYIFRQMDGYGHTDIWDSRGHADSKAADAVRDDWLRWMHWLRHKEMPVTDDQTKLLEAATEKFTKGVGQAEVARTSDIGGSAVGKALLPALRSKDRQVRSGAAAVFAYTASGKDALQEMIHWLDDPNLEKDFNVPEAIGLAANWRHLDAQNALGRFALDKTKPVIGRWMAARSLGRPVRLSLLGNFEDNRPLWTLVVLLDDDESTVRSEAFDALASAIPDGFGYKPDLKKDERQAAVEKWKAWCKEKCGACPADLTKR
ncbi:MAG: dienelactone hydrolase family protein [Gemmataceae bacterium]|nr:dienelactone hydrolase family protein [Gemmataceae bacterium]